MNNETIVKHLKPGRKPITETYVSEQVILDTYRELKSMRKTAEKLRIALRTVFKYVRLQNASRPVGQPLEDDPLEAKKNQRIAKAIDKLSGPLPHSVAKIRGLLNDEFECYTIRYFLKSRRNAAEFVLRRSGNLLDHTDKQLRDIYGRMIQVGYIAQYEVVINQYDLNVTIGATLKFGGKVTCRMSFMQFKRLLESSVPSKSSSSTLASGSFSSLDI